MRILLAIILFISISTPAFAECVLDGRVVSDGTRVGSLVCTNGEWVQSGG